MIFARLNSLLKMTTSKTKAASLFVSCSFVLIFASDAFAYVQFQKEFQKTYAGRENREFRDIVRKAKCFVCHQGEDNDHKFNNAYGQALAALLGEDDKKDKKKINDALEKIAAMPSDANDPESKTFGDLILAGELPGGSVEDAKKDPVVPAEDSDSADAGADAGAEPESE